jgi:hypothetical protein
MKVKFCCDSGANIHSKNEEEFEATEDDLGYTEEDWKNLSDDEKYQACKEYWQSMGLPDMWYEEIE